LSAGARTFVEASKELGNTAELYMAEGQSHAFFNRSPWLETTTLLMDKFLTRYGYVDGEPTLRVDDEATMELVSASP
jgi:hypothetical protein